MDFANKESESSERGNNLIKFDAKSKSLSNKIRCYIWMIINIIMKIIKFF